MGYLLKGDYNIENHDSAWGFGIKELHRSFANDNAKTLNAQESTEVQGLQEPVGLKFRG